MSDYELGRAHGAWMAVMSIAAGAFAMKVFLFIFDYWRNRHAAR